MCNPVTRVYPPKKTETHHRNHRMIIVIHVIIIVIMVIVIMVIVIIIVIMVNIITIVTIVILTMRGCGLVGTCVVLGTAVDQRFETTLIRIRDGCGRT